MTGGVETYRVMSATVYLNEPIADDESRIECTEVKIIGDVVWATPDEGQETIIPLSNVTGVRGDTVEQEIEAIEAPGGQFTELITDIA